MSDITFVVIFMGGLLAYFLFDEVKSSYLDYKERKLVKDDQALKVQQDTLVTQIAETKSEINSDAPAKMTTEEAEAYWNKKK